MLLFRQLFILVAIFIFINPIAYAWHDTGHMVIAEIAKKTLNEGVEEQVEFLIKIFEKFYPESSTIVTSACWMDDLGQHKLTAFGAWHYITIPYDPDKILNCCEIEKLDIMKKSNNIVWAIGECLQTLKNPKSIPFEKAIMLRFLLHLVGDIHQPLHTTSRFTKLHPEGDLGGNLFKVQAEPYTNLHQYWDSGLGIFPGKSRPLSYADKRSIEYLANQICSDFPHADIKDRINDKINSWVEESHKIATEFVYEIEENSVPKWTYIKEGREICRERTALAGYRLAYLLNDIFK
jgi:S1/P1 Nuclease